MRGVARLGKASHTGDWQQSLAERPGTARRGKAWLGEARHGQASHTAHQRWCAAEMRDKQTGRQRMSETITNQQETAV